MNQNLYSSDGTIQLAPPKTMPLSAHTIQLKRFNYIQVNLPICRNHFPGVFEPQLDEVLSLVLVERRDPDHVGGHPVHRDLDLVAKSELYAERVHPWQV